MKHFLNHGYMISFFINLLLHLFNFYLRNQICYLIKTVYVVKLNNVLLFLIYKIF